MAVCTVTHTADYVNMGIHNGLSSYPKTQLESRLNILFREDAIFFPRWFWPGLEENDCALFVLSRTEFSRNVATDHTLGCGTHFRWSPSHSNRCSLSLSLSHPHSLFLVVCTLPPVIISSNSILKLHSVFKKKHTWCTETTPPTHRTSPLIQTVHIPLNPFRTSLIPTRITTHEETRTRKVNHNPTNTPHIPLYL